MQYFFINFFKFAIKIVYLCHFNYLCNLITYVNLLKIQLLHFQYHEIR